jgi:two-component system OmpR family response regulator
VARRVALVEDDTAIRANLGDALKRAGYEVASFADRPSAWEQLRTRLPELALVDLGLGAEIDGGFTLVRDLRALSPTLPIIILSARDSDFDIVSGLRLGADDYLTKDVSQPHLLARIAALFRRADAAREAPKSEDTVTRGKLTLDTARLAASWNGAPLGLTVTEFWMLHALVRFPGHVKNREQLMGEAEMVVDDGTITSHVKRIRRKFEALDASFNAIETVYGMGYRWTEG